MFRRSKVNKSKLKKPTKPKRFPVVVGSADLADWLKGLLGLCKHRALIKPSEWQELHRFAPPHSPRPGKWHNDPFQIEPFDAILDENCSGIVLDWASQFLGKSSIIEGILGWQADQQPSAVVSVFPTVDAATQWSKNRFTPLIESIGVIAKLFRKQKTSDIGSTILHKHYPGGWWVGGGANSPAQLASHTARITTFDEVDRYVESVGTKNHEEGDPVLMVQQRSAKYRDPFSILTSTPTVKHYSRIEKEYATTDQRKWFVPCPKCKQKFVIMFNDIKWPKEEHEDGTKTHRTAQAYLECPACKAQFTDTQRQRMVEKGKWVATNPGVRSRRGYWANGFIVLGPHPRAFTGWLHYFADRYLTESKTGTKGKREFLNLVCAETFEIETVAPPDHESLYERREVYAEHEGEVVIPERVLLLTAGIDVQRDRVEVEILGWGLNDETWGICYKVFRGNPQLPGFWTDVDLFIQKRWRHATGHMMWPACTMIDSGDKPQAVYNYTRRCAPRPVYCSKGFRGYVPNWINRSQKRDQRLFILKVDTPKETIYSSLRLQEYGPGYSHFPANAQAGYDLTYFVQLTNERLVLGGSSPFFEPKYDGARNEALDIRVLNHACKQLMFPEREDWTKAQTWLASAPLQDWRPVTAPVAEPKPEPPAPATVNVTPLIQKPHPKAPSIRSNRSLKNWLN